MKTSRRISIVAWAISALLLFGPSVAGGGSLADARARTEPGPRSHHFDGTGSPARLRRLVRTARPLGLTTPRPSVTPAATPTSLREAPSYSVPATPPNETSGLVTTRSAGNRRASLAKSILYTRYEIADTTAYPFVTHGRLFVDDGRRGWYCSATIVTSTNESTVATAAHCLYDRRGWVDDVYFAPGYREGVAPFGYWRAESSWATGQWTAGIDRGVKPWRYDVAFLYVPPLDGTTTLMDAFGSRGIAFNQPRTSFTSFGYPAERPFDGEHLFTCESAWGGVDRGALKPRPNAMGCDMTGGSSGGGWIAAGTDYVNSVVSYSYDDDPDTMYGPYYGLVAQGVYLATEAEGLPIVPAGR